MTAILDTLAASGVLADVKRVFEPARLPQHLTYWSL